MNALVTVKKEDCITAIRRFVESEMPSMTVKSVSFAVTETGGNQHDSCHEFSHAVVAIEPERRSVPPANLLEGGY